jgi:hypothetical protein
MIFFLPINLNQGITRHENLSPILPHHPVDDGPISIGHITELHTDIGIILVNDLNLIATLDVHHTTNVSDIGTSSHGLILAV